MRRTLTLVIECGATTCASTPGVFCKQMGMRKFGQVPVCMLFHDGDVRDIELVELDGWVQRCPECLAAERRGEGD